MLGVQRYKGTWVLDSGCSKHMTGDKSWFNSFCPKEKGSVTFGDNGKGKILGIGSIGMYPNPIIENVLLVKGLKHNLLSISQLCDKGNQVIFESSMCHIKNIESKEVLFVGHRFENVYIVQLESISLDNIKYFSA